MGQPREAQLARNTCRAGGSRYGYSNPAILFLGRIIEIVTGDPYALYIDKNILKPLGMHRTYFDVTPYHLIADRSNSYTRVDGQLRTNGLDFDTGITVANSGLNAPLADLGLYAALLLGGDPTRRAVHDGVLARASIEEMFEPTYSATDPVTRDDGANSQHIGLTFFVTDRQDRRFIGHTGSQQGYRAFLYIEPAAGTAAIAVINTDSAGTAKPDAEGVLADTREAVFSRLFTLFQP